jgi:N-acetylmuramoyl-L-alanine amidase
MADWENVQPDEYKLLGCNYSAGRPYGITGVTIHHMAGDLDGDACNRVWSNAGTSAHYCVDSNGYITQHVNDTDRAWACGDGIGTGGGNDTTISIEHANNNSDPWTVYEAALDSGAHLTAALCKYYNLGEPSWMGNVFPHKHWSSTACPGELAGSQNDEFMTKAKYYYNNLGASTGSATYDGTTYTSSSDGGSASSAASFPASSGAKVNVHYALHNLDGDWNDTVTNFGDGDEGFAGMPCGSHDMLIAWCDEGTLNYQVHTINGEWLPMVSKGDFNDDANGMAGNWGEAIDGVRMYYTTPDGQDYKQVYYRSQTADREGWLDVVCDDGTTYGGDDYAGIYGEALDRLQVCITDGNPF